MSMIGKIRIHTWSCRFNLTLDEWNKSSNGFSAEGSSSVFVRI